jgi:hypothetical protein
MQAVPEARRTSGRLGGRLSDVEPKFGDGSSNTVAYQQ